MVSPKKGQRRLPASSKQVHKKRNRIIGLLFVLFLVTVGVVAAYEFMLSDVHAPAEKSAAQRLRRRRRADRLTSGGRRRQASDNDTSDASSTAATTLVTFQPEIGVSNDGKRRRKVALTPEQKEERRKALAKALQEKRAKQEKETDAQGYSAKSIDDDWKKDGFAQKPSWWDR